METKINFDNVGLHVENDIIFCSVKRFKLFLAERNYDAYTLFSFYMMTARVQDTKQVWANDVFVRNGLKWGKDKMQKAKKFLIEKKMIKETFLKDDEGKFYKKIITLFPSD